MRSNNTYLVYGPPGSGKTTWIARQVGQAVAKHGYKGAMVCSLTRTAAHAAAGATKDVLSSHMVGTLHAHAYRALGRPEIAEGNIKEWNGSCEVRHRLTDSAPRGGVDDPHDDSGIAKSPNRGELSGDQMAEKVSVLRANRLDPAKHPQVGYFYKQWTAWKKSSGYLDFADLIEQASHDIPYAPGNPRAIFVDEAQDISLAEYQLLESWAHNAEQLVIVGDTNQALYTWRGACPDEVFDKSTIEKSNTRTLCETSPSWRVPENVLNYVRKSLTCPGFNIINYVHRDGTKGAAERVHGYNIMSPNPSIFGIIDSDLKRGESVMIIATCGYMLSKFSVMLKAYGYRFHNPYRPQAGQWNPVPKRAGTISVLDRINAFLKEGQWTVFDVQDWLPLIKSAGTLNRGFKKQVEAIDGSMQTNEINTLLHDAFIDSDLSYDLLIDRNLEKMRDVIMPKYKKSFDYLYNVYKRNGRQALKDEPKITIGTIHSVKGGEADNVYLSPSLPLTVWKNYKRYIDKGFYSGAKQVNYDQLRSLYRQMYVGMTRAKNKLTILSQGSGMEMRV